MIKLFWNTHNQIVPNRDDHSYEEFARNHKWGFYHKENSDKWIYKILEKIQLKKIENEKKLENDDILIIVDSSVEKKIEFYDRLKLVCSKIFLIHLGDESTSYDLSPIYKNCTHVWRTFCANKYFADEHVSCLPLGYKSGTINKQTRDRKYKWSFIGTPHKSSRHDMLFQFSTIKPSFCYKTEEFDKKIINVKEMSQILSTTEFIPCPNGFFHPETYRLYETLECGCIPIVENAYKYYDRLFPSNPFLKVDKWIEAKSVIQSWGNEQIKKKREECELWWSRYKNQLQEVIKKKLIHERK